MRRKGMGVLIISGLLALLVAPAGAQRYGYDEDLEGMRPRAYVPPFYRFSVGIETELTSRDVEEDQFTAGGLPIPKTVGSADMTRVLARVGFSPIDNLEIYGVVGGSTLQVDAFDGYNASMGGAYGGGVHWIFYEAPTFSGPVDLFVDYRFLRFRTKDQIIFQPFDDFGNALAPGQAVDETITWNEHRLKLGVSGRHYIFEPYGGVRFSIVRAKDHLPLPGQDTTLNVRENDIFGLFLGTNIYLPRADRVLFFIEGDVLDENALALGVRMRF